MTHIRSRKSLMAAGGLTALLVLVVPFAGALGGPSGESSTVLQQPSPAPELRGAGLDEGTVDLADLRGKVVLVNIWASWCEPCRREMPLLTSAARQHAKAGLSVVGVNTNDRRKAAVGFLEEIGGPGPAQHIYDPDGDHAVAWGSRGIPETFVVDPRGRVVARHFGEVTREWLQQAVLPLLDA